MYNMKKVISGSLIAVLLTFSLAGCGSKGDSAVSEKVENTAEGTGTEILEASEEAVGTEEKTRTIVDHTGVQVTLPADIDRVVISSILPLPSVYCLFKGSAEDVVAIHPSSMAAAENSYLMQVFPELANADTGFVENGEVNIEELISLDPDVVFYSASNTDEREMYDKAGIPAVGFSTSLSDFDCVETYADWISLLGDIYGEAETANQIIAEGRETAEQILSVTADIPDEERPKVLILFNYADGVIKTSGSEFFGQYWIDTAGGRNVAEELSGSPEINMEQIYEWDPDMIFITNFSPYLPEDLYNNTIEGHDWSNVSAVKNGQVYKFPLGMYRWFPPASDTPLVLKWLAKTIQPERFADMDIDSEIKDYYQEYYGVTLTDEDLLDIYHPAREAAGT